MQGENLGAYLEVFGETVTWTHAGGTPVDRNALFQAPGMHELGGSVISLQTSVLVLSSDFKGAKRGDGIVVQGGSYSVREIYPVDDGAFSILELSANV